MSRKCLFPYRRGFASPLKAPWGACPLRKLNVVLQWQRCEGFQRGGARLSPSPAPSPHLPPRRYPEPSGGREAANTGRQCIKMRFLATRPEDKTLLLPSHTSCPFPAWRGAEVGYHSTPPACAPSQKHCSVLASSSHAQSWASCLRGEASSKGSPGWN